MKNYDHYETLLVERLENNILKVSMNSPETLNAVNGPMHAELSKIFYEIARDRDVDVVILTGTGRAFSAGGDLEQITELSQTGAEFFNTVHEGVNVIKSILQLPQPLISMVNGAAVGLGATLALYADIIIASENAKFADPHVKMGLVAGDGGAVIWPLLIGPARAKEYLMTGKMVKAKEAKEMGLVNHIVPLEELESKTMEMANELANGSKMAIQMTKRSVNMLVEQFANNIIPTSLAFEGLSFRSNDVQEAVSAFKEKRPPNFKQR